MLTLSHDARLHDLFDLVYRERELITKNSRLRSPKPVPAIPYSTVGNFEAVLARSRCRQYRIQPLSLPTPVEVDIGRCMCESR